MVLDSEYDYYISDKVNRIQYFFWYGILSSSNFCPLKFVYLVTLLQFTKLQMQNQALFMGLRSLGNGNETTIRCICGWAFACILHLGFKMQRLVIVAPDLHLSPAY